MRVLKILLVFISAIVSFSGLANHVIGGNISYECLGADTYGITLTYYKDCYGSTSPTPTDNIFFFPTSGACSLAFSATGDLVSETEISDLCDTELVNSSCNGGIIPGVNEVTYYAEVFLDPTCTWDIVWSAGDWAQIANIDYSSLPNAYILTQLNPTFGCGDSPTITTPLDVPYVCVGEVVSHQVTMDLPAGYTVDFAFANLLTDAAANTPGYNSAEPIPGIAIDPITGQISFTAPAMFGTYAVAVEINIYDGSGNLVGTMIENIGFEVRACTISTTEFTIPEITSAHPDVFLISDTEASVCVGDSLCLTVEASNLNIFRTITLSSDFLVQFPGQQETIEGLNPVTDEMCLLANESMIGSTVVTIDALDDACPNPDDDQIQLTINVLPNAQVDLIDAIVCNGQQLDITATGDTDFTWTLTSGTDPGFVQGSPTQSINPTEPFTADVIATNGDPLCTIQESISVDVSLWSIDGVVTDESCAGNDGEIDLTVQGGVGSYDYDWESGTYVTDDITGIQGGQDWTVTVTNDGISNGVNYQCTETAPFTVGTSPAPTASIVGDATICNGDCTDITFAFTGTAPFDVVLMNMTTGVPEATGAMIDGDTFSVCPTATTTYELQSATDSNVPSCTYTVVSSVIITVRPVSAAAFLDPGALCGGDVFDLEIDIAPTGIAFNVDYSIDAVDQGTTLMTDGDVINLTAADPDVTVTITNIEYVDAPLCSNATDAELVIDVDPLPVAVLSGGTAICAGAEVTLHISLTGTGPWEIEYTVGGVAAGAPLLVGSNEWDWLLAPSPSVDTEYCLTNVIDTGTDCAAVINSCTTVLVNVLPTGTIGVDGTICVGDDYGITLDLATNGPYTVVVEDTGGNPVNGSPFVANDGDVFTVSPTADETYCLQIITDDNACVANVVSCVAVTVNPLPTIDITDVSTICLGDCQDIPMVGMTGTGPFNVSWELHAADNDALLDTGSELGVLNGDTFSVCPNEDAYVVVASITDNSMPACASSDNLQQYTITVNPYTTVSVGTDYVVCEGTNPTLEFCFTNYALGDLLTVDLDNGQGFAVLGADLIAGCWSFQVSMADPALAETFTITTLTNDNNACTQIDAANSVDISVAPVPTGSILDDATICEGDDIDLTVSIPTAGGPFDIEIQEGSLPVVEYLGVVDGEIITISPSSSATYTLQSVTDNTTTAGCTSSPGSFVTITVTTSPEFDLPLDILCSNTGEEYTYTFGIQGGDIGTYIVTPTLGNDPGGTDPNAGGGPFTYTSGNIPTGSGEIWEITDANGCSANMVQVDPYDCPVITYSGTADLTAAYICDDGSLTIIHNLDEILDGNDVLNFIIQDIGTPGTLGTVYNISTNGVWNLPGDLTIPGDVDFDTQYYVAAVAGNDVDMDGFIDDLAGVNISISEGVPVTFLETPTATITEDATICEGMEATIQVDFTGSPNYNFEIALDGVPQGPITDVATATYTTQVTAAGIYTIIDVDNTYCAGSIAGAAEIIVNPLPTAAIGINGEICSGDDYDFDITLTGTAPWDMIVGYDDGAGITSTNVNGIAASPVVYTAGDEGFYYVSYVIDDNGCESVGNSNMNFLTVNPLPTATFNTIDDSFCSGTNYEVSVAVTGDPDFTIVNTLNAVPSPDWIASGNPYLFDITDGGDYCIESVTDNNGCMTVAQDCVTVDEIPIPTADAGLDIIVCSEVDVLIGTLVDPTLSYQWTGDIEIIDDPLIAQPTANALNMTGGDVVYNLTLEVSDAECPDTDGVMITVQAQPNANAGLDVQLCWGDTYQLGATGGLSCLWEDNGTFIDPVDVCDPLVAPTVDTEYVVTVTDGNNCSLNDTLDIIVPTEYLVTEAFPSNLCVNSNCVGEITLTVEGGWGISSVDWVDFADQNFVQTDVCDGSYDYTVIDEFGCEIDGTISIGLFPEPFIDDISIAPPTCFGTSTGIVTVHDNQAMNWTQEGGETNFTGDFYNLSAGTYTYITQDINGCLADSTILIESISPAITFNTAFDTITVCVETPVDFIAVAGGGIDPFEYNWYDDTPPLGANIGTGSTFTDTPFDTPYTVWVIATDAEGCDTDTLTMTAVNDPPIQVIATPSFQIEICQGECVDMSAIATGGNGNVELSWYELDTFGDIYLEAGPALTVCPMAVTTYIVWGEDDCQFPANDTVFVIVRETPDVEFTVDFFEGCFPTTLTFTNETDPDLTESCLWDLNNGDLQAICGELEYTYTEQGTYWPTLTVTSEFGCTNTDSLEVAIEIHGYPVADFEWDPDPVSTLENEVQFVNTSFGAISYNWDIAGMLTTQWPDPSFTFPPEDLTSFPVCLEAINEFGCADTICKDIFIESVLLLYAPNAFTPDLDGLNDVFLPVISGITSDNYVFRIFDRWGHIIFETFQTNDPWIGDFQVGSHYVQNDVYIWQIEARELATGDRKRFTGNVTIAR